MKKLTTILFIVIFAGIAGCSTHGTIRMENKEITITQNATFQNVSVTDESGYIWGDDEEKIDLAQTMKTALDKELEKEKMAGSDFLIKTSITHYEPGNAFKRWLLPGDYGATKLTTNTEIYKDDILIATIPVERYVGFGGGFTVGAWKKVFNDVAKEIVKILKEARKKK